MEKNTPREEKEPQILILAPKRGILRGLPVLYDERWESMPWKEEKKQWHRK
jgi:hypothetical protein